MLDTNYLNVNVPVITQQPHSRIIQAGDTVSFLPGVSNASSYQWYFAGAPIAGANSVNLVISNVPASAAGNYYLRVANAVGSAESQTVSVQIQSAAQTTGTPTNLFTDKFGDAVDLTGGIVTERYQPEDAGGETGGFTLSQAFSTVGATKEEGEPDHAGQPGGASYWYSYTAPGNGTLQFNTTGSTFDTILAVYTGPGDSFSTLVNVGAAYATNYAQQGQPAVLVTNASTGTKYYIAIDGYLGASGAARLNIILNQATNAITSHEIVPLTNDNAVIFMTAPFDNFSTTKTSLTVRGVVRGLAGAQKPFVSSVQLGLNGNPIAQAALGASRYSATLTPEPGGTEGVVAQEGVPWSATVTLVPGANIITAQSFSVQGDNTQYVSRPVTHTVYLVTALPSPLAKSILTLVTSPSGYGKITGQPSQASLELNKVYSVKAVPTGNWIFTNWTSGTNINNLTPLQEEADLQFIMTSNLILQANFMSNPFTAVSGSYNGLFSPASGVTEESSGFFSATLPPAGRGAYSARLLLQGTAYPFSGVFDLSGNAQQTVNRSGDSPLTVDLHLSLTAPDDQLTGTVTDNGGDNWSSSLLANRAQSQLSTNYSGRYTVGFPPPNGDATNQPGGYGFATLTKNAAGHVSINGRLADNSHLSQYVSISKNGNIPLYVSLYSRQGLLLGWLTLTNLAGSSPAQTLFGSNLTWIKVGGAPGKYYASGFTNADVTVLGSHYAPPSSGSGNFNLTNATLTIGGGGMTGALVYSNLSLSGNKLSNIAAQGNPPVSLQGVISPSTGVLTLTFRPTGADSDIVAKGVILQDTNAASSSGAGWFLGADQSGFFLLQQ